MSRPEVKRRTSNRRSVCFESAAELHARLPRPYNFASYLGWGLRKLQLASEIEAYDALRRDILGRRAQPPELRRLGELLLEACNGEVPLEGDLMVTADSFEDLHRRCQPIAAAQLTANPRRSS